MSRDNNNHRITVDLWRSDRLILFGNHSLTFSVLDRVLSKFETQVYEGF